MIGIYSLYDVAIEKHSNIFFAQTDKVAVRQFKLGMKNIPNDCIRDLVLVKLGFIDEATGDIEPKKEEIFFGDSYVEELKEEEKEGEVKE